MPPVTPSVCHAPLGSTVQMVLLLAWTVHEVSTVLGVRPLATRIPAHLEPMALILALIVSWVFSSSVLCVRVNLFLFHSLSLYVFGVCVCVCVCVCEGKRKIEDFGGEDMHRLENTYKRGGKRERERKRERELTYANICFILHVFYM